MAHFVYISPCFNNIKLFTRNYIFFLCPKYYCYYWHDCSRLQIISIELSLSRNESRKSSTILHGNKNVFYSFDILFTKSTRVVFQMKFLMKEMVRWLSVIWNFEQNFFGFGWNQELQEPFSLFFSLLYLWSLVKHVFSSA